MAAEGNEVWLDKFAHTSRQAATQAAQLHPFIKRRKQELRGIDPVIYNIFGKSFFRCLGNIVELGADSAAGYYIVRDETAVMGLATVLYDRSILHPSVSIFEGNQIDYWLPEGSGIAAHEDTVAAIVDELAGEGVVLLASSARAHPNPQLGFAHHMQTVGEPVALLYAANEGCYSRLSGEPEAQLYVYPDSAAIT